MLLPELAVTFTTSELDLLATVLRKAERGEGISWDDRRFCAFLASHLERRLAAA